MSQQKAECNTQTTPLNTTTSHTGVSVKLGNAHVFCYIYMVLRMGPGNMGQLLTRHTFQVNLQAETAGQVACELLAVMYFQLRNQGEQQVVCTY